MSFYLRAQCLFIIWAMYFKRKISSQIFFKGTTSAVRWTRPGSSASSSSSLPSTSSWPPGGWPTSRRAWRRETPPTMTPTRSSTTTWTTSTSRSTPTPYRSCSADPIWTCRIRRWGRKLRPWLRWEDQANCLKKKYTHSSWWFTCD